MTRAELIEQIRIKKSFLCIGLDTDIRLIPQHLLETEDPIFEFNKKIIDATADLCIAYKPNIAFYESLGYKGWISLEKTLNYIPETIFTIADAKRGDIGNTSELYARTYFETYNFDAVTVAPYMGHDSVEPFLSRKDKWAILLALTSNQGAMDFQFIATEFSQKKLFEKVLMRSSLWGSSNNLMYVIGATQPEMLKNVRQIVPDHFLLVPGIGAQGGNLKQVSECGMNKDCGLIVNASRSIIYAGRDENFADMARTEARRVQMEMEVYLKNYVGF